MESLQVEKLKAEAANQQAEVKKLHATTVHQMYTDDLDAFLAAYEAWEAEEAANSGAHTELSTCCDINHKVHEDTPSSCHYEKHWLSCSYSARLPHACW